MTETSSQPGLSHRLWEARRDGLLIPVDAGERPGGEAQAYAVQRGITDISGCPALGARCAAAPPRVGARAIPRAGRAGASPPGAPARTRAGPVRLPRPRYREIERMRALRSSAAAIIIVRSLPQRMRRIPNRM